ncbi:MAG: ABC transporter permease [Thermoplasmatales archaeon]
MVNIKFIIKRAVYYIVIFFSALTIDFVLPRLAPGDPAEVVLGEITRGGEVVAPGELNALKLEMGISNKPIYIQYYLYIIHIFKGQFGLSLIYYPTPVTTIISYTLPWTLFLVITATVVSFFIGNKLGMMAAIKRAKPRDYFIMMITMFFYGIPAMSLGLLLIYIFPIRLGIFPEFGNYSSSFNGIVFSLPFIASVLYHAILPILTIVLTSMAGWVIGMRNNFIPQINDDYINFYRSMGVTEKRIRKAAYKNAFLPNLTGFAMALGFSVTGVIIIEEIFSYPGVGYYLFEAVTSLDYPLLEGLFLIIVIAVLVANLTVEIIYSFIDPRVNREGR